MIATGLFEAHLAVRDLDRSLAFYRDVAGLPLAHEARGRGAAFLWVREPGEGMLGLWSLGSAPFAATSHVALAATLDDVLAAPARLRSLGVTPLSFAGDEADEPSVIGWMPAAAVYFRDPDGHLLEHLAMLDGRADAAAGVVPWSEWTSRAREPVAVERHAGPRDALRPLFALAEDSDARLDSYLDAGEVLVAREGDRVVGHLQLVVRRPGESEIANMAVEKARQRRGIGRALLRAATEEARARGDRTLAVATAAADVGNLRFYQRAGFRLRSVERDAFTPATGYAPQRSDEGIELRDRVWLDLELG
jgi:GNAT superfamily N-acetyltransferase/catechol 2,3-dioxygenase-like lactoylglutathione lyase family enzyme